MPDTLLGVAFSVVASFITWVVADTKSKSRLVYVEEALKDFERKITLESEKQEHTIKNALQRVVLNENKISRAEQDLERLDNVKASKEIVDSFKAEITTFRAEMDRRFDTIERLLSRP